MTAGKRIFQGAHFECNYRSLSLFVWEILVKKGKKRCWKRNEIMPNALPNLREAMLHGMKAIIDVKGGVTKY